MELTNFQAAGVKLLIKKLMDDPSYAHPMPVIKRLAGTVIAERIREERASLLEYNKLAKSNVPALSATAMDYWAEARAVLTYGRLALSQGSRTAERTLSRKCEALEESFAHRVPDQEKGHFLIHDINDGKSWDDRWHCCVDYNFPLLRDNHAPVISNVMREAQISILGSLSGRGISDNK